MNEKTNPSVLGRLCRATGRRHWCLAVVVTMLLASCGGDGDSSSADRDGPTTTVAPTSTIPPPAADKARAQRIVLTAADVPGFTAKPPDPEEDADDTSDEAVAQCAKNNPLVLEGDDPRSADSPDFSKGDDEETVSSSATFAETEEAARLFMADIGAPAFAGCFDDAFTKVAAADPEARGVTFKVSTTPLPAPGVGDQSVAYRSVITGSQGRTRVTFNGDFTFIRTGRALAFFAVTKQGAPFRESERMRLASVIARRMASA